MSTSFGESYRAKKLVGYVRDRSTDAEKKGAMEYAQAEAICALADAAEEIARVLSVIASNMESRK